MNPDPQSSYPASEAIVDFLANGHELGTDVRSDLSKLVLFTLWLLVAGLAALWIVLFIAGFDEPKWYFAAAAMFGSSGFLLGVGAVVAIYRHGAASEDEDQGAPPRA